MDKNSKKKIIKRYEELKDIKSYYEVQLNGFKDNPVVSKQLKQIIRDTDKEIKSLQPTINEIMLNKLVGYGIINDWIMNLKTDDADWLYETAKEYFFSNQKQIDEDKDLKD